MSTQPGKPNKNNDELNESFAALGQDFEALGSVLEDEVKKAVGSLAQAVQSTVNSVTDGVRDGFSGVQPMWQQMTQEAKKNAKLAQEKAKRAMKKAKRSPEAIAKKANGEAASAGGTTLVAGIMTAVTLGIIPEAMVDPGTWIAVLVLGVLAVWFAWMSALGFFKSKRLRRLSHYMSVMGDRTHVTVQQIAAAVGKSETYVRGDLRKILSGGLLEGAYLSPDGTRLFVSETAYRIYLGQQDELRSRAASAAKAAQNAPRTAEKPQESAAPQGILTECDTFIAALRERNARIDDLAVTAQVEQLAQHTHRIRTWLAAHPRQENRVRRFTGYYLPTILKLLDTYCDLELHAVPGSVAQQSQQDITEILATINTAFQTLEDGLVQDTAMDVSAEISALQTVMAQEGLTQEDDFAQVSPQL